MRINQRLDWRALALLGALLSFSFAKGWPGLVYAMPALTMISNQTAGDASAISATYSDSHTYRGSDSGSHSYSSNDNSVVSESESDSHSYNHSYSNSYSDSHSYNHSDSHSYNHSDNYSHSDSHSYNYSYSYSYHNLNSNSSIQSDHSLNQNQSISAEFTTTIQPTAIATTTTSTTATPDPSSSTTSPITSTTTAATVADDSSEADPLGFVISSAPREHLAILSRTERSIRHQQQHLHHQQLHQHRQQQHPQQQQLPAAGSSNSNSNFIGSKSKRLNNYRNNLHINSSSNNHPFITSSSSSSSDNSNNSNLDRNERSTLSHLAGPSRKIQIYIKNHFLQLLPDGTVNGTQDETCEHTILQRSTVDVGRIKIQGVATCLYLCMAACGAVYGSKDFLDDCVFNENMELHNYNTYSSTYNSNAKRVLYLALNRNGVPRRTQIPATRSLGKLATYTNAITETVPQQRVEQLIAKNFGANRVKHGVRQLCDTGKPLVELIDTAHFKARPQCNASSATSSGSGSSSSSSRSGSNSSSNVPVPAASASSLISISNSSQSVSGHISSSSSSSTSSSSNSNSNSNSSSSNSSGNSRGSSNQQQQHQKPKRRKLRKCRPHEKEELHNCQRRPGAAGALRKLGPKALRCKELRAQALATGGPPPNCGKKPGPAGVPGAKRNGGSAIAAVPGAPKGAMANPRGAKKKQAKGGGKQRPNAGGKKQRAGNAGAGKRNGSKRQQRLLDSTTTTRTMTTTAMAMTMASSLSTPGEPGWESSSPLPAMALSETSDRVERNVRMSMASGEEELEEGDDDDGQSEHELDSQEDVSYEDATLEGHARSGAADDSVYYDALRLLLIIHLPLSILWTKRTHAL